MRVHDKLHRAFFILLQDYWDRGSSRLSILLKPFNVAAMTYIEKDWSVLNLNVIPGEGTIFNLVSK